MISIYIYISFTLYISESKPKVNIQNYSSTFVYFYVEESPTIEDNDIITNLKNDIIVKDSVVEDVQEPYIMISYVDLRVSKKSEDIDLDLAPSSWDSYNWMTESSPSNQIVLCSHKREYIRFEYILGWGV